MTVVIAMKKKETSWKKSARKALLSLTIYFLRFQTAPESKAFMAEETSSQMQLPSTRQSDLRCPMNGSIAARRRNIWRFFIFSCSVSVLFGVVGVSTYTPQKYCMYGFITEENANSIMAFIKRLGWLRIDDEPLIVHHTLQPHTPTWGATIHGYTLLKASFVSIHAPTWGATAGSGIDQWLTGFNPRPYMRGDCSWMMLFRRPKCFNPRPYMRGD